MLSQEKEIKWDQILIPSTLPVPSHAVIKLTNIAWDLSSQDVVNFFSDHVSLHQDQVHIPIDSATGKTRNELWVEMRTTGIAVECVTQLNRKILKTRAVTLTPSSYEELCEAYYSGDGLVLTREYVHAIGTICRNYKVHFSQKCAERPFEHAISVARLAPWHSMHAIMRDRLFDLIHHGIEALCAHLDKPNCNIDHSLLPRMVQAVLQCPAFTEAHKTLVLETAHAPKRLWSRRDSWTDDGESSARKPATEKTHGRRSSVDIVLEKDEEEQSRNVFNSIMLRPTHL